MGNSGLATGCVHSFLQTLAPFVSTAADVAARNERNRNPVLRIHPAGAVEATVAAGRGDVGVDLAGLAGESDALFEDGIVLGGIAVTEGLVGGHGAYETGLGMQPPVAPGIEEEQETQHVVHGRYHAEGRMAEPRSLERGRNRPTVPSRLLPTLPYPPHRHVHIRRPHCRIRQPRHRQAQLRRILDLLNRP